ncbi:MAG: acyltransferase [Kiritimatiellae bacterium]|nr:acyltransferase [Kiritimatiellia bacterium]
MSEPWQTHTGLTRAEFARYTRYCNASDNDRDNRNRAEILGFGPDVRIGPHTCVRISKKNGCIGRGSSIGMHGYLNGEVLIGENVTIGPHCSMSSHNHVYDSTTRRFSGDYYGRITIGDGSWIGPACVITAGVSVGRANLILPNATVTKDTPEFAIMAGTPARQVGRVDPQTGELHWNPSAHKESACRRSQPREPACRVPSSRN